MCENLVLLMDDTPWIFSKKILI